MSKLSIIVPVLNEGERIAAALDALSDLRSLGSEVIVVDGGSRDATIQRARLRADRVIAAPRGRASQMNAGAARASGDVLLFLHADTRLPKAAEHVILHGLERSGRVWGRFNVKIEGRSPLLLIVGRLMDVRSRLTGIATGDQAIFVRRDAFESVGGFAEIAADGRHRFVQASQAREPALVRSRKCGQLRPAVGAERGVRHHPADVAATAGFFLGRRSNRARAPIRL